MAAQYQKSGYLHETFRIFHNADAVKREIPFHYHDFHKLLLFLSGNVTYTIEGRQSVLNPGDICLVRAGQIHRPVIHDTSLYERIIFYIDPAFFDRDEAEGLNLFRAENGLPLTSNILHPEGAAARRLELLTGQLKEAAHDTGYAAAHLRRIRLTELLILLCRSVRSDEAAAAQEMTSNPYIAAAIDYIHEHLADEDLSIDRVAEAVSLGRSYLMHLFRSQIGYTVGKYITEKRLYQANTLLKSGMNVTQACYQCGFRNYAAFYYAYQQKYGSSPSQGKQKTAPAARIEGE